MVNLYGIRKLCVVVMMMALSGACNDNKSDTADAAQQAKDANFTIAYIGYSATTPFWNQVAESAAAQANKMGVNYLDLSASRPDVAQQKIAIDNAIIRAVDGLVVGPVDSRGLDDSFSKAQAAGIPVVTVDTQVDHPAVISHIGTDNVTAANLAGKYMVEQLGPTAKILILGGTTGSQTSDDRHKGVQDIFDGYPGIESIYQVANWDPKQANEITNNVLNSNADLDGIFAACDPMIFTAMQAVKSKGKLDDVLMVGFDAIPAVLKAIKNGEINATIRQDPQRMGREGIELLVRHLNGEEVSKFVPIQAQLIDVNNVDGYLK